MTERRRRGPGARKRPVGVTVLAVLFALSAAPSLLALIVGVAGTLAGALTPTADEILMGFYSAAVSGLALAFAYGAWRLRRWALVLGVAAQSLSVAVSVSDSFITLGELDFAHAVTTAISAAIVLYLLTPPVHRAFTAAEAAS